MRTTISDREFTFISQMIYRINSQTDYESVCRITLQQLASIIPLRKGLIFQIREENNQLVYRNPVTLDPPGLVYDENTFMGGGYRSDWLLNVWYPWSSAFRSTDIRDEEAFRSSKLYWDVYAPQNIYYGLHAILIHQGQKLGLLGLFRSREDEDFTQKELFIVNLLSIHLELKLYSLMDHKPAAGNDSGGTDFMAKLASQYGLTRREAEVACLIYSGKNNQEMVESLYISRSTLDKHLYNIYRKTGVGNRTELFQLLHQI